MKLDDFVRGLLNYFHAKMEFGGGEEVFYRLTPGAPYRTFVLPLSPYTLFRHKDPVALTARLLFHEVGHLLVAPKSRRNRPDYGIPTGSMGVPFWDHEDNKASLIEVELCRQIGVQPRLGASKLIRDDYWSARLRCWYVKEGRPMVQQLVRTITKPTLENLRDWEIVRPQK